MKFVVHTTLLLLLVVVVSFKETYASERFRNHKKVRNSQQVRQSYRHQRSNASLPADVSSFRIQPIKAGHNRMPQFSNKPRQDLEPVDNNNVPNQNCGNTSNCCGIEQTIHRIGFNSVVMEVVKNQPKIISKEGNQEESNPIDAINCTQVTVFKVSVEPTERSQEKIQNSSICEPKFPDVPSQPNNDTARGNNNKAQQHHPTLWQVWEKCFKPDKQTVNHTNSGKLPQKSTDFKNAQPKLDKYQKQAHAENFIFHPADSSKNEKGTNENPINDESMPYRFLLNSDSKSPTGNKNPIQNDHHGQSKTYKSNVVYMNNAPVKLKMQNQNPPYFQKHDPKLSHGNQHFKNAQQKPYFDGNRCEKTRSDANSNNADNEEQADPVMLNPPVSIEPYLFTHKVQPVASKVATGSAPVRFKGYMKGQARRFL